MRAIQYLGVNNVAITNIDAPAVTPGYVLLRVTAAGVCQTDIHVRASAEQILPSGVVLGHKIAGTIVETADDVTYFTVGDAVIVHPVGSCGMCRQCVAGRENACLNTAGRMSPSATPGVSVNVGIADFVSVPQSVLVRGWTRHSLRGRTLRRRHRPLPLDQRSQGFASPRVDRCHDRHRRPRVVRGRAITCDHRSTHRRNRPQRGCVGSSPRQSRPCIPLG